MPQTSDIASPCIRICQLNANQTCLGCGRTLQEIAMWSGCDNAKRREIVANANARLQSVTCAENLRCADVAWSS